jgi:hypothetical protein
MVEMAVARSARWTTSTTTADTSPIAAVMVAPPTTIRTNWTTPGPTTPKAVTSRPAVRIASPAGTTSRARGFRTVARSARYANAIMPANPARMTSAVAAAARSTGRPYARFSWLGSHV